MEEQTDEHEGEVPEGGPEGGEEAHGGETAPEGDAAGHDAVAGADAVHGAEAHVDDHSPMAQFEINDLVSIKVEGLNLSFTNSALLMAITVIVSFGFLYLAARGQRLVPTRMQMVAEMTYNLIANMVRDNVGNEGRQYFPFIFTLFMFVLIGNLLGLLPYSFTFTSHIIVTFTMAAIIFISVTAIGIVRHGAGFGRMFFPHGAPVASAVVLIPIELISYLSRPISLSVRLFANMTVGHVLLKIIAGFVISIGAATFIVPGIIPFGLLVAITILEILVAVIQAYVFTILTCIYLHDAYHMH